MFLLRFTSEMSGFLTHRNNNHFSITTIRIAIEWYFTIYFSCIYRFSTELSTSFFFSIINVFRQISPNIRKTANPIFNQTKKQKSLYITVLYLPFSTYAQGFLP